MPANNTSNVNQRVRTAHKTTIKRYVQNLINIYKDNWCYIILEELNNQVSKETFQKYKFLISQELNVVKRVVNDLSTIYVDPAKRRAVVDGKEAGEDGELKEVVKEDENYELSQEDTNKDDALRAINQYTNLSNNTMLKVTYRNGKLDYDVLLFNNVEIYTDPDDWKEIIAIKYYNGLNNGYWGDYYGSGSSDYSSGTGFTGMKIDENKDGLGAGSIQDYYSAVLWTKKDIENNGIIENGTTDEVIKGGKVYTIKPYGDLEQIVDEKDNPYIDNEGNYVLPFVLYNRIYPIDDLLDFTTGNDLKDLGVNVAILIVWLNTLEKYQSFKQIVFNTDDPESIPQDLKMGPADILVNPTKDGGGSVDVLDLQTDIKTKFEVIKERIMNVLTGYHISPQNFTMSGSPASGFSLKISNIGKLEYRKAQLPMYRKKEKELYDIEKVVWNYHRPSEQIDEDAKVEIDFAEIEYPKSPQERISQDEFDLRHNLTTELDLLKRNNPDLTEDMAKELYLKNKTFNELNSPQLVQVNPTQQPGAKNENGKNNQASQGKQTSQRQQASDGKQESKGSNASNK